MRVYLFALAILFVTIPAFAQECQVENRACVITVLSTEAAKIDNVSWRDQTYREIAKTLAADGKFAEAIPYVEKIQTPDTKAMTIRGIGMAAADKNMSAEELNGLFTSLRAEAAKIQDPPSFAIALTYIAMGQAFAGDNDGAWKTAGEMENEALRHKAYGETAEIQAEKGNYEAVVKSIGLIGSASYQDKCRTTVSQIFADHDQLQNAYNIAAAITNPYKKSQALQYILDIKNKNKDKKDKAESD